MRKATKALVERIQTSIETISALPGIADMSATKRVPKGFYAAVEELIAHYDAYAKLVREGMELSKLEVAGRGAGVAACYEVPTGVSGLETLNIYRAIRPWKDFPKIASDLGRAAEQLFADIQSGHKGKDPKKIRMTGGAVRNGRRQFARRAVPCPFLDERARRCRIWDQRPVVCRMHHINTDAAWSLPTHANFGRAKAKNIRLPVRQQLELARLDKRMEWQPSPFLYAGVLQLLQLADGELINEVGEAPRRMQQDGRVAQRANRNVRHAAKHRKKRRG
ncbi:MAG: YkgJ family cysteine cluster protein [Nannocystaceae bacterium]